LAQSKGHYGNVKSCDFFLEKDIATLTMLYANIQMERIDWYKMTMQMFFLEALEALNFEEDRNYKDYSRLEDLN